MRILVVQESDWISRGPHQQHQLFDRLSVRGHDIRVVDYDIDWNTRDGLFAKKQEFDNIHCINDKANIKVIRPGMVRLPILNFMSTWVTNDWEIKRQVKEFKPDVIVGLGILNADIALFYARRYNIPFVYFWIDILHMLIPLKPMRWFGKYIEEEVLKLSDKVVVINNSMRDYVMSHGAREATVISGGVDLKNFKPTNLKIREQYGVKKDETLLFFMGYVYSFSGLEQIAHQLTWFPKIKLMIVGDGESFGKLNRIRDEYQLGDRLITIDKKPYKEIPDYINASDVCILPSEVNETMRYIVPIKIYEYMALGKPIISTRLPGVEEEFSHYNGIDYVNKPEDVLQKSIDIKLNYIEMGLQSKEYVSKCDWNTLTDKMESLLEEAICSMMR
jgi:glycosyltransferase involved in cell wall biosynthesis